MGGSHKYIIMGIRKRWDFYGNPYCSRCGKSFSDDGTNDYQKDVICPWCKNEQRCPICGQTHIGNRCDPKVLQSIDKAHQRASRQMQITKPKHALYQGLNMWNKTGLPRPSFSEWLQQYGNC